MNRKYDVRICWSAGDRAFVAEVPELPGCMAHGDTHGKTLQSANEAIAFWLHTAKELGRSTP